MNINIKLFVLDINTQNHVIVNKQMTSKSFKNSVTYKLW